MPSNLPQIVPPDSIVLVAGAAGFLGSHLTDALIASGSRVVGIDDFVSGHRENLESLKGHRRFDFIEANINEKLPKSLFSEPISHIVHVANIESYLGQERLELNQLLTNSFGVKNLLDLAQVHRACFVLSSSLDIYYGIASSSSLEHYYDGSETESSFSYREAKRFAEALCQQYADLFDLDIRIARLAEVYGPRMSLTIGSLLARLIRLVLSGKDLVIDEEGSREHLLCYVSDATYGLIKLLFSEKESVQKGIFSFVNPERVSTLSIAYILRDLTGGRLKVDFLPAVKGFQPIRTRRVDVTRTKRELYWSPRVEISDGLKMTLEWFIKQASASGRQEFLGPDDRQITEEFFKSGTQDVSEIRSRSVPVGEKRLTVKGAQERKKLSPGELLSFLHNLRSERSLGIGRGGGEVLKVPSPTLSVKGKNEKGWLAQVQKIRPKSPSDLKGVEARTEKRSPVRHFLVLMGLFALLLLTPFFLSGVFAGVTYFQLNRAREALFLRNFPETQSYLGLAQSNLLRTRRFLHYNRYFFYAFGQKDHLSELDILMSAGFFILDSGRFAVLALEQLEPIYEVFVADLSENFKKEQSDQVEDQSLVQKQEGFQTRLFEANLNLSAAENRFALSQSELNKKIPAKLWSCFEETVECNIWERLVGDVIRKTTTLGLSLGQAREMTGVAPFLFGMDTPHRLLVLLQNNTELRATGGFLGSYAVLTFDKGRLVELKIDDIYNPDGVLKQKIAAPSEVQRYMDVAELGIRDSNWWPHFPESAERIATLYEFATNEKVNTVVALNLEMVRKMLSVIGPVRLSKYDETIDSQNLFERTEVHAEVNFEPGSTQKKDFLTDLTEVILGKISELSPRRFYEVLSVVTEGLWQKEMLLYSRAEEVEEVFSKFRWGGEVIESEGDYLFVVDSNVGGNKANYWIQRETNYQLTVDRDGNLSASLTVSWEHRGKSSTWPGGEYQNYLRIYMPLSSELIEKSGFIDTPEVYEEFGKRVLGGLVKVPIDSTETVKLRYQLPRELGFGENTVYRLLVQKQSGITGESFSFRLSLPPFLKAVNEESREIIRKVILDRDQEIIVEVERI